MARMQRRKFSKKELKAASKAAPVLGENEIVETKKVERIKKKIFIPSVISVTDLADVSGLGVSQVITELMKNGVLATINETIDFETAAIIGDNLGLEVLPAESTGTKKEASLEKIEEANLVLRPPVVTVMGHVDHGKTSLLDKIRTAHVADSESGGITQHISAYQITLKDTKNKNLKNRTVTFIDTPGHAAFQAMREHGTAITDIVVLIVAANDGVKPQTAEVINQAKENNVPVIVAINKVDLPDADAMKTKQQLSEYELVPEEWGGKTVMVEVSAKTGQGVDNLLEMILLKADLMELKANPKESAVGIVIESHMHKGAGAMALVLIENGTLKKGDPIAIGSSFGKVRILEDSANKPVNLAGPSFPVRIAGLKSLPRFGDRLLAFKNEKEARDSAQKSEKVESKVKIATSRKIGDQNEAAPAHDFNIIIKSDVQGSLEAIKKLISEINCEEICIRIVSEGVGPIAESDITLAKATGSKVIGFRIKQLGAAKKIADKEKIQVETFDVIYELIDKLKEDLSETLPPEIIEEELGKGKILAIFRDDRKGFVCGGSVDQGKITMGDNIKFLQNDNEKYRDKVSTLRKEKNEVKECGSGSECGFGLQAGANVAVGDTFIAFKIIEKKRTIS